MAGLRATLMRIDCAVGNRIAAGVRRHHSRRLGRLGSNALDPPPGGWADGNGVAPPRDGTRLQVLVDGDAALRAMVEEVRSAVSHVHLTAWFLSPSFVMAEDGGRPVVVRDLLAETARRADVRVLLWAGAPIPVFRPSRRAVRAVRDELAAAGPIRCALDSARAAASLPPREDCDRRRPGRLRRRDRLDVAGRRSPRLAEHIRRAPPSAGTMRRSGSTARWWPTSPPTSPCAGVR